MGFPKGASIPFAIFKQRRGQYPGREVNSFIDAMAGLGKTLIYLGLLFVIIGLVLTFAGKVPWLGRLPGDLSIERENFSFYFPLATCILISVIVSLVLYLFRR